MKLWIGAEIEADISDSFRQPRKNVEIRINDVIEKKDYQFPAKSWDCIVILRSDDAFSEKIYFSRNQRNMDFRLRLDYTRFKSGSELDREKMIFDMLLRSLDILKSEFGDTSNFRRLVDDLSTVGMTNHWIRNDNTAEQDAAANP